MTNYFDKQGNYINCENLSLAEIYHRAFALGVKSTPIEDKRPQGEWVEDEKGIPICSVCHNGYKTQPRCMGKPMFEHCPICGAKMQTGGAE